ncbi:uncharacterized protein LOC123677109 isoform X6 [Harmonia axyridis]|uniref:uncharacterized protein LOC123677109 isoform X6 n=1 Tax=Harmonia axyridis TaxID=115357 RepID=UPI001E275481|nr:uncharacterized protein LOC123677109 isoform X6 [Harmonia axyridis]
MTTREVVLEGGSPWGFRIHGGVDTKSPLRISRVNSNGKAALRGIREGEIIASINGQPTKNLAYSDAHSLIKNSGDPLRLELTLNSGSPRQRKRNRPTVHETHSETLKSTSSSLYARNSTKTTFNDENEYADPDQYLRKQSSIERQNLPRDYIDPPASPDSTVSSDVSSCSTLTEAGTEHLYKSPIFLSSSPQTTLIMADNASSKTRKKRIKNQRKKQRKALANLTQLQETDTANISNETKEEDEEKVEEVYKVDFPKTNDSKPKPKLKCKSKSLDDDDDSVKIQEVDESGDDDKHQCEAIVSEADSDWEETTDLRVPQNPVALSTIAISIDEEPLERIGDFSPEQELCLRNFLEGINLVNSPGHQPTSTLDSMQVEKSRKRDALMKYFTPLAQNPRFLDIISEEGSDISDRESSSLTRHLKQGTPELENTHDLSIKQSPRVARRNKFKRMQLKRHENKAVLVCTKIVDTPSIIEHIHTCTSENTEPETVFLESSSDNASSENSSDTGKSTPSEQEVPKDEINEDKESNIEIDHITTSDNEKIDEQIERLPKLDNSSLKETELATENNESHTELITNNTHTDISEDTHLQPIVNIDHNSVSKQEVEHSVKNLNYSKSSTSNSTESNIRTIQTQYTELTPPPTPEHSPKKKLSTDSSVDLDFEESLKEIVVDTAKEITSVLCKLAEGCETTFIVNQTLIPSSIWQSVSPHSPSESSSSSGKTSPSTVRFNAMTSSIADVASISTDLEFAKETAALKQPLSLRQICLKFLLTSLHGMKVLQELSDLDKLSTTGNLWRAMLENDASLNLSNSEDANNSHLISETTEKLREIMSSKKWAGLPFYNNPDLLAYLSPTQRTHLEEPQGIRNGSSSLSSLHSKLTEKSDASNYTTKSRIEISSFEKETVDKSSNISYSINTSRTLPRNFKQTGSNPRLQVSNLDEWLNIAREGDKFEKRESILTSEKHGENVTKATKRRRTSLPDEIYQRQLQMILQKEKEIEQELESLLEEKRKLYVEMRDAELEEDHSSEHDKQRPKSFPQSPSETMRQRMYEEYMKQVAEREERKHHKMIKLTSTPTNKTTETEKSQFEALHMPGLEDEFMKKVQERHGPLEKVEEETSRQEEMDEEESSNTSPVLLIDGTSVKQATDLPKHLKHLKEFVEITADIARDAKSDSANGRLCKCRNKYCKEARRVNRVLQRNRHKSNSSLLHEIDAALNIAKGFLLNTGVWSPGQRQETQTDFDKQNLKQKNEESIPSFWQPKSATSSPVAERKEYRPVSFESPKLGRKNKSEEFQVPNEKSTSRPPWQDSAFRSEVHQASTLERRIPNSRSAPTSAFNELTIGRLPRAQNPTVTLLQKAREGQLPKGANYLEANRDHYRIPHDLSGQGDFNNPRRNDHYSESDSEIFRSTDSNRRKIEGVGPVSSDGMPLSLRSEVSDTNQSKWYKKMYDTIHKQKPYKDEFVTVRYKPRRAQYPYISGYLSEPEPGTYDSDQMDYKYATLDRRRMPANEKQNFATSTMPRNAHWKTSASDYSLGSKMNPGRIENYIPGRSSISEQESKKWWDEVMDIFDGWMDDVEGFESLRTMPIIDTKLEEERKPITKGYMSQALKESGYESDSTLVFRKKDDGSQISPTDQREAYKIIQKGGDIPLHGLRKPAPERPKEPEPPVPPPKSHLGQSREMQEGSPRKYVENQVTIHYKTPVRQEIKDYYSEDELAHRQQEAMKKMYQEERRRKYLQELQDMHNRRHTDNFIPSQKSPIPLNRYDDFDDLMAPQHKIRPRSPEPRLVARALYNFVGMTPRELTFRKGDNIYVRRQIDKNWYEGELNAMVGLFPVNYVEIVPYENVKSTNRKPHEGQARAKYNFLAKTHLELSLAKGEMVIITRRVDNNWYEGKIGGRKGIFPASYVDVLIDPQEPSKENPKPVAAPAAHSLLLNGSSVRESMGSHTYTPNIPNPDQSSGSSYYAKPIQVNYCNTYGGRNTAEPKNPVNQALHIDTRTAEPIPFKALYKYLPQNDDELELMEGDTVYVLEKCDDGWFVGSNERTGAFGTFPGNYVDKV